MTPKQRLSAALRFEQPDRPPHFEQMFELNREAFGLSMPGEQAIVAARGAHRRELFAQVARIYQMQARRYAWDAVLVWQPGSGSGAGADHPQYEFIRYLKDVLGPDLPVGSFVWGSAICIDTIKDYMQFAVDLYEQPQTLLDWAERMLDQALVHAERLIDAGCDIIDIANDYAFNAGPFLSPADFARFTTPYMKTLVRYIQGRGVPVIFHSDGNLMPVLDQILEIGPDALQSIDPMAGMDIALVKRLTHGKMALMGNVQCSYLQDGPDEKIRESVEYCMRHAAPGGGFIFSTSNTVFEGLPLRNYEYMLECFRALW